MRFRRALLVAAASAPLLPSTTTAQVTWETFPLTTGGEHFAMTYDPINDRVYRFGGILSPNWANSGLWQFADDEWELMLPAVTPEARYNHTLSFDSAREEVVLFGGTDRGGAPLSDTWVFTGTDWLQRSPVTSPSARTDHGAAFDTARGQLIVFGGTPDGVSALGETWAWNGTDWTELNPATNPAPRFGHGMVYDSHRQVLVMFGGRDQDTVFDETWEWNGSDWIQASPTTTPGTRWSFAMAFHGARGRAVLMGGLRDTGGPTNCVGGPPWEWDGTEWNSIYQGTGGNPGSAATYEASRRRVVFFSGRCPPFGGGYWIPSQATWAYTSENQAKFGRIGTGCAGSAGPLVLDRTNGSFPWTGDRLSMALQPVAPGVAAFGFLGSSLANWGPLPLPLEASFLGASGCTFYTGIQVVLPLQVIAGRGDWALDIPVMSALVGQRFHAQGILLGDPVNAGRIVLSNAIVGEVGVR